MDRAGETTPLVSLNTTAQQQGHQLPSSSSKPEETDRVKLAFAVFFAIVGQTMQNICLPLALSDGDDMGVVLAYMCFVYFVFFSVLDILLDVFLAPDEQVATDIKLAANDDNHSICNAATCCCHHERFSGHISRRLIVVGFLNALNGVGLIFGGSESRTPLTLQMSFFLLSTLFAPWYKMMRLWGFTTVPLKRITIYGWKLYATLSVLFLVPMILVINDKIDHGHSGTLSGYCIFFIVGTFFGMVYNVEQDLVMSKTVVRMSATAAPVQSANSLSLAQLLQRDVHILRRQLTWLCFFSWIGVILSVIGAGQGGDLTTATFRKSWSDFLAFNNLYMNLFNLGYIICFISNIVVNRYDSAFTMIVSNISAVSSMWTGWMPSISAQTVGFSPNVPKTVVAIALSAIALVPSWLFSKEYKAAVEDCDEGARESETEAGPLDVGNADN